MPRTRWRAAESVLSAIAPPSCSGAALPEALACPWAICFSTLHQQAPRHPRPLHHRQRQRTRMRAEKMDGRPWRTRSSDEHKRKRLMARPLQTPSRLPRRRRRRRRKQESAKASATAFGLPESWIPWSQSRLKVAEQHAPRRAEALPPSCKADACTHRGGGGGDTRLGKPKRDLFAVSWAKKWLPLNWETMRTSKRSDEKANQRSKRRLITSRPRIKRMP